MGILGSAWGTAEELLHPRDRFGRFAKKRAMPEATGKKVLGFLDKFNPRQFQSDGQASQYLFNRAKHGVFEGEDLRRLHFDWDEANDHIRAGDIDPETQRFIDMMDRGSVALPEQLIVTKTVGPEAFGLTPEQLDLEDGGLRDLQGRLFADRGYSVGVVGTPMGKAQGRIAITIATPRGTKAIIPARSGTDRGIFFERGQRIRVTRVKPDGLGGWQIMAIAEPEGLTPGQTPEPLMPGRRGAGLSEAQRRERITPSMTPQQRLDAAGNPPMAQRAAEQRGDVQAQPAPAETAPAPAPPSPAQGPAAPATGVPERQEAVQTDSVGPTATKGTSPAEIAQGADQAAQQQAEAQSAPAPATPASFVEAMKGADLKAPSRGKRQKEFNDARVGIASGKQAPEDALRQLDTDIEVNKRQLERQKAGVEKADPELEQDIKDQEALADLISSHHGVPRRSQGETAEAPTPAPAAPAKRATKAGAKATKAAPAKKAGPTPTPGAPSTSREAAPAAPAPKKAAKRAPQEVADAIGKATTREAAESELDGMTGQELKDLATHMEAPVRARATKAQLRQAILHRKGRELDGDAIRDSSTRQRQEAGTLTDGQKKRIVSRAKQFRGQEANDEERRIVAMADEIEAGGTGEVAAKAAAKKAVTPGTPEAKKAAPAKAVAKKATPAKAAPSPVDAEEEAFKQRVKDAGLPDKVADLRARAKAEKIRGFSTMNKGQLQRALLGEPVNASNKIGVVPPAKMIPHLEAAKSDQDARALLSNHTLVDLKALAKEREIKLPSRGATKPKITDMILEDIRGPQEGIGGRTPDTSLTEDLDQLGYIDLPGANGNQIKQQIAQVDGDDADSLRQRRDDLEKLSKQFRGDGDKNAANMAQAAADAMGMRAQTISGVEEAAPPVKRVAKKAAPAVPEGEDVPEVERPLEKMLKPELLDLAQKEGASVRPSWSKARILDEIKKNRRMDSSRGPETEQERLRRELGAVPGGAERDLGPTQGPLQLPNRAPTAAEIAEAEARDLAPAPVKKATKKAAKKAAADVDRAAGGLAAQVRSTPAGTGETFGDILRQTDAEELRQEVKRAGLGDIEGKTAEEIFDNTIKKALEDRMRELGMLPDDPKKPTRAQKRVPKGSVKGPKADQPIATDDRRKAFTEAWDSQGFADDPSMTEVRDRIASGEFTHEEGVRRLDSEIAFHEEEMSDLQSELEGMAPEDRDQESGIADGIHARRAELSDAITNNKKAIKFLRGYAKDEAPVTRQELEVKLDPEERAAFERIKALGPEGVADLKRGAKEAGLGDIEGDDLDTVTQNIARKMADREMADRVKQRLDKEKEKQARDRQTRIDDVRGTHDALAQLDQMAQNEGSDKALQAGIKRLPEADRTRLTDALGDREQFRRELDAITQEHGLTRTGHVGDTVAYDPQVHDVVGEVDRGSPVMITRAGHSFNPGNGVVSFKARAIPDPGGTIGPRKAAPSAPKATGISTPGQPPVKAAPGTAAGRITTARLTPGTRIMVQPGSTEGLAMPTTKKTGAIPVTVTKVEGVAGRSKGMYRVTVTDDNGNTLDLGSRGASQTHMLEPPPKAPKATKKATQAARPGPISPAEVMGQLSNIENPPSREESKALLDRLNGRDIRPMAKELHIPTSGKTNDQIRDEIIEATSGRLADAKVSRGFGGTTPTSVPVRTGETTTEAFERTRAAQAAKKVAKAAVPAKAAPKAVDLDNPTRHNAELIGTGLDLDPKGEDRQWLDVVQRDLDRGTDGRQIADGLRREADAQRTIHNIQEASGGTAGASPEARINRMELMADRLEGVRPLKKEASAKAVPETAAGPGKREMDTMQAASAQSDALRDLRNGKSHAEVATALRARATSVGSKDHDVQTVRPLEFTPSERSAMKRNDAKKLRELAAEIQAQGVAQRSAAKAAKKAPAKKAASGETVVSPAVDRMVRQGGTLPGQTRRLSELREAAAPPPKKRTAAEMRRAEALAGPDYPLEQVLADWDRQKEERKNLTGPVGEMIVRQMDDALRRLNEAKTPGREDDALAGLLAPELRQLAIRLGVPPGGSKAEVARKIIDRVKGREAPTTSAERAVPKVEAPEGADGLDDLPEHELRRLAIANGVNEALLARPAMVRTLRAKGVVAPKGSGSLAAERAVQDSAPVKWSYGTRDLSTGGPLLSPKDRGEAARIFTEWTLHSSGSSEPPLNKALRGKALDVKSQADVDAVDRILEASKLPRPVTVYRGYQDGTRVLPKDFDRDLTGHTWTDPAYTATTSSEFGGQVYAGNAEDGGFYARIRLPAGFPAIGIQDDQDGLDDEGEMILPRGLEFHVIKDHGVNQDGIRELDLEVRRQQGPVSGVDYSNPAFLKEGHAKDLIYNLNHGDTPDELIEGYIEDGLSPEMAKLLVNEVVRARQAQMPTVIRDAIDEQIQLRGRTRVSIADLRASLSGLKSADFDQVLRQLAREGRLQQQENQQQLTQADRDAEFKVGARTYHFITRS